MVRRHDPVRTCVGCRQRAAGHELLRVVASDPGSGLAVVPDPGRRLPGRGAHLHPTPECLALALRRRAFPRALRVGGALAVGPLEDYVAALDGNTDPSVTDRNWSISS